MSKVIMAEHTVAAAIVSAVILLGLGFGIWGATSVLPYPADAIPAPQLGHFTF